MRQRRVVLAICAATALLAACSKSALAIPPFFKAFQEKYVKADATDEKDKEFAALVTQKAKCNVCHKGTSKKMRNAYGSQLAMLLKKADFAAARLKDEPDKVKAEIDAALDKVAEMKSGDENSPTFGALIAEGKLPGGDPTQTADATEPAPEPAPTPAPTTPEPAPAAPAAPPAPCRPKRRPPSPRSRNSVAP